MPLFPKRYHEDGWRSRASRNRCARAHPKPRSRRGSVLILTLILLVAMIGMVAFAIDLGCVAHARTVLQRTADACALAAARHLPDETSALAAVLAVAADNNWSSDTGGNTVGGPMSVEFGFWDRDQATFTSPAPFGQDANSARVTFRRTEATGNELNLFFSRIFDASTADVTASATALYDHWLCGPFVGIDSLKVPGTALTDSYNSVQGPYGQTGGRHRGSICSDGPVDVGGTASVKGNARAGKGQGVTVRGSASISRGTGTRLRPMSLPPVDASQAAVVNDNDLIPLIQKGNRLTSPVDNQGNFRLESNDSITLPPGTYYFRNVILTGQAKLSVSGPTKIYVTGDLRRAGGTVVSSGTKIPKDLQFLMTNGSADVTSDNAFHGVIYGPNSDVKVSGSADFFGAVVGKTLTITGTGAAHYDESLDLDEIEFPKRVALVD